MKTIVYKNEIGDSALFLNNGGLVAVPTETVYGLACNGLNSNAIQKLYDVKGRPSIKPISLLINDVHEIIKYTYDVPQLAFDFANKFWPGPLTIILKSKDVVPEILRANEATVGLRCPNNELTLSLLNEVDFPLAVPSANPSGKESPKNAEKVYEYFNNRIEAIIDNGPCELGFESTIIDFSAKPFCVIRNGSLNVEDIKEFILRNTKIIGITGGSGSGKTTLLQCFSDDDALVIDCDNVYHNMLENDYELLDELKNAFSNAFINGSLDRNILSNIVFNNPKKLTELNFITHKFIFNRIKDIIYSYVMSGGNFVVIDAIELFTSGIANYCEYTIGVISTIENRVNRIMKRDGITRDKALKRIQSQKNDEYYINNCNYIIENNSNEYDLKMKYINEVRGYGKSK